MVNIVTAAERYMKLLRPYRLVLPTTLDRFHTRTYCTMPRGKNTNQKRPPKEPKPQITHFLCLPLVNSTSLPQLEASIAAFKAAVPSIPRSQDEPQRKGPLADVRKPLIPDGAIRPLETLHLTLGVMSLPTKERLQEALEYFQSLDLVSMMHEAEGKAQAQAQSQPPSNPQSFNVSLESLEALPKARVATVLHAVPVDPTSRLYPFCEILRDKFLEAGFILGENKGAQKPQQPQVEGVDRTEKEGNDSSTLTRTPPKPNVRPLLLHATVVNTIYVKGRQRSGPRIGGQNHGKKNERYTFDARDILEHYQDYYLDDTRTTPRSKVIVPSASRESSVPPSDAVNSGSLEQKAVDTNNQVQRKEKIPFVWAKDFPIDSVCICEMGAKKLDPSQDTSGLHARLGEKYQVIAERSLSLHKQA